MVAPNDGACDAGDTEVPSTGCESEVWASVFWLGLNRGMSARDASFMAWRALRAAREAASVPELAKLIARG